MGGGESRTGTKVVNLHKKQALFLEYACQI